MSDQMSQGSLHPMLLNRMRSEPVRPARVRIGFSPSRSASRARSPRWRDDLEESGKYPRDCFAMCGRASCRTCSRVTWKHRTEPSVKYERRSQNRASKTKDVRRTERQKRKTFTEPSVKNERRSQNRVSKTKDVHRTECRKRKTFTEPSVKNERCSENR
eukprot:1675699-Rhodomonas_salina.4